MQDANVGGHDPFSIAALGWAKPIVAEENKTYVLRPFQESHDLLLLSPSWNSYSSPFDEYLLLEYYTPTRLNEFDVKNAYGPYPTGPRNEGIRIWHVDARLLYADTYALNEDGYYDPVYSSSKMTSDPLHRCQAGVSMAFTNSVGDEAYGSPLGSDYDQYNELQLIRNNIFGTLHSKKWISDTDLFHNGSTFSMEDFSVQFPNGNSFNNGKSLSWSLSISISSSLASISVSSR